MKIWLKLNSSVSRKTINQELTKASVKLHVSLLNLGHIARTCLRRKAWTVCKPQRSWDCYQRQMAWCRWSDSEKSYFAVDKTISSSGKAEWRTYSAHFLLVIDWWLLWRFSVACVRATTWRTACKHRFMICNTISFVARLIQKCFRRKFPDLFGYVCSLNTCFQFINFDYSVA